MPFLMPTNPVVTVSGSDPIISTGGSTPIISIQNAAVDQKGAVQLEDSTTSISIVKAATPNSVKNTHDYITTISGVLRTDIDDKSDIGHLHDDRYYTESEVDTISGSLNTAKMDKIVSVDEEIVRFDGTDGAIQGYISDAPTISDNGKIVAGGGIDAPYLEGVKEENTGNITKGQVVCITGAIGGYIKVGLADCDNSDKMRILGLAFESISQNNPGIGQVHGTLTHVDTQSTNTDINPNGETWTEGQLLYLSRTPGGLTNVRPVSGRIVKIARTLTGSSVNDDLYILGLKENPVWATAAADENVVLRVGDSAGANKVSIRNYDNEEKADFDSYGNLTLSGTVDGVDITIFKFDFDTHDHDDRYYTESEVDDLITTVSGKLDDHNEMNNLDYASSGHTGFASSDTLSMASAVELTLVSGTVTRTQTLHRIDTEGDTAIDDLDTIIDGADGDVIIIRAENGTRTVTLKDGTGNLKLGGRDLELIDTNMAVMLYYSGVLGQWLLIGDGGGSATAAVSDDAFSSAWDGGTAVAPSRNAVYDIMVTKSDLSHLHDDRYYIESEIDTISGSLNTKIDGKADTSHIHDDRYYTETEIDTISGSLSSEIDSDISTHAVSADHDGRYYTEDEVDDLTWTESDITDLDKYTQAEVDTISGSLSLEIDFDISTHEAGSSHDSRYYTETELDAGQLDNRYYTESEVDTISGSLNTAKSNVGHSHTESDISDLDKYTQAEVDGLITTISGKLDDHNELNNLDYASSGHTGFASSADLTTVSGTLQTDIDTKLENVIDDTDPELGADLSCNGYNIENIGKICGDSLSSIIYNDTGSTLIKGTSVTLCGLHNEICTVCVSDNREIGKMPCCGVIDADIADGAEGCGIRVGRINMDTSGMTGSVKDRLYVQSDGSLDTVIPTSGMVQRVGLLVKKASGSAGRICVCIRGTRSMYSAKNQHPIIRMGDDVGHQKAVFRDYYDNEVFAIDNNGNLTISGTVDGVDIDGFKSDFDGHTHDDRYYTEGEVDTISGSLQTNIDGKADTGHTHDAIYYTETELDAGQLDNRYYIESEIDTISGSLNTKIDGKSDTSHLHDDRYYTETEVDSLITTFSGTIDHNTINNTHNLTTDIDHDQTTNYQIGEHRVINDSSSGSIDLWSAEKIENRVVTATGTLTQDHSGLDNLDYASSGHTGFAQSSHNHTESDISDLDKYTEAEINTISGSLQTTIDGKSDIGHVHDSRYYTESEVDTISGTLSAEIDSDISTHASNADVHHAESHTVASHSDTTATGDNLNELVGSGNTTLHNHDTLYYTETEVDTISGTLNTAKSNIGHTHTESDISDLDKYTQAEVDTLITTISGKLDDHNELNNLDYASSGHTGFQPAGDYATDSELTTLSGNLQTNIDGLVSDTAYGAGWNGVTDIAPSKNSIYDEIETKADKGTNSDITSTTALTQITRATGGAFDIAIGGAAGDDFTVDTDKLVVEGDSGNVGIGTTNPGARLDIVSTSYLDKIRMYVPHYIGVVSTGLELIRTTQVAGAKIETIRDVTVGGIGLNFWTTADSAAETAGTYSHCMVIDRSGNVGIGTTEPDVDLEVGNLASGAMGDVFDATIGTRLGITSAGNESPVLSLGMYSAAYGLDVWVGETSTWNTYFDNKQSTSDFVFRGNTAVDGSEVELMRIDASGNVGIGTTAPGNPLAVNRSADGIIVDFESADVVEGNISIAGNTTSYNAFVGSHYTQLKPGQKELPIGAVVISTGEIIPCEANIEEEIKEEIEILVEDAFEDVEIEKDGEQIGEEFDKYKLNDEKVVEVKKPIYKKTKKTKRQLKANHSLDSKTGKIIKTVTTKQNVSPDVSNKEYFTYIDTTNKASDKAVYGVWFGKMSDDSKGAAFGQDNKPVYLIAQVGLFKILVTEEGGNIEIGDYLETSTIPMLAQKQNSSVKNNSTVAKALVNVDFSKIEVNLEFGCKAKLIPCIF